jgi:hypothetical protein
MSSQKRAREIATTPAELASWQLISLLRSFPRFSVPVLTEFRRHADRKVEAVPFVPPRGARLKHCSGRRSSGVRFHSWHREAESRRK